MMELLQLCKLRYPSLIQSAIDAYQLQIVTGFLLLTSVTQQYLFIYSFIYLLLTMYLRYATGQQYHKESLPDVTFWRESQS